MIEIELYGIKDLGNIRALTNKNKDIFLNLHDFGIVLGYIKKARESIYLRKNLVVNMLDALI